VIAAIHLVWQRSPPGALEAFLDSYRKYPAGIEHELVLLLNGFREPGEFDRYRPALEGLAYRVLFLGDAGLDVDAYQAAAKRLSHDSFCFLNSYSELLAPGWLKTMADWLAQPGVGSIGATGSYGSHRSFARYQRRKTSPYAALLPPQAATVVPGHQGSNLATKLRRLRATRGAVALAAARDAARRYQYELGFADFPSPHLRTNAFMITRDLWRSIRVPRLWTKVGAHRFESGTRSLTAQITGFGLQVLVVDRDGRAYEPGEWWRGNTFWQGDQENLLVADNQTRRYAESDERQKAWLSRFAWGERARPSVSVADFDRIVGAM